MTGLRLTPRKTAATADTLPLQATTTGTVSASQLSLRLHADSHSQFAAVFRLAYLLGIELMPQMRPCRNRRSYRAACDRRYRRIDVPFSELSERPADNHVLWRLIGPFVSRTALQCGFARIVQPSISASKLLKEPLLRGVLLPACPHPECRPTRYQRLDRSLRCCSHHDVEAQLGEFSDDSGEGLFTRSCVDRRHHYELTDVGRRYSSINTPR